MEKFSERDTKIFTPRVFNDERGFFFESYNSKTFEEVIGYGINFVQDNHSKSTRGVLRGMHYQLPPFGQGKLVRVISGEVYDVAIDIRKSSKNFGKWFAATLSEDNKKQFWIPEGFAHGFIVISDQAELLYKTTNYYNQKSERSIRWDDPYINISWPKDISPITSLKDKNAKPFNEADFFE